MKIDVMKVKEFHGHLCPGLAMGIRVAEMALMEMGGRPADEELVAIVESDNCAVDAIQYITGCTFGKGNLIHLDYGKNAFRFIRRSDGKAIRILVKPGAGISSYYDESLAEAVRRGDSSVVDKYRQNRIQTILTMPLFELLEVQTIEPDIPPRARLFDSAACARCGEMTMEPRLRLMKGLAYCQECFEKILKETL